VACGCASVRWNGINASATSQTTTLPMPPVYCCSLLVCQNLFLLLVHRIWHSWQPCHPPLTHSYSQEYISRRYSLRHIHERRRHHGLVQRHVFMPRLRPFSCDETFHYGDRWPRQAETNRGGVLA